MYGAAATQLCGCDAEGPKGSGDEVVSFTTMVLALWTLALGAYTWFWLRKPIRPVHFPSNDLEVRSVAADAEVHEEPPIEGMLLMTLRRINGMLERAQRSVGTMGRSFGASKAG